MNLEYVTEKPDDCFNLIKQLTDGLWYIKTENSNTHVARNIYAEYVGELPPALPLASLEPYRVPVAQALSKLIRMYEERELKLNVRVIINTICNAIKNGSDEKQEDK